MFDGDDKLQLDCLGEESLSTEMKHEGQLHAGELAGPLLMDPSDIKGDPAGDTTPPTTGMQGSSEGQRVFSDLNQPHWFDYTCWYSSVLGLKGLGAERYAFSHQRLHPFV